MTKTLLEVDDLKKHYPITKGVLRREVGRVRAVDGISFEVREGETVGLVGESGCGKSTAATTLLRLEEPTGGDILFDGENVTEFDAKGLKAFRRRAQMIFQDPTSSFDPRMSVGESIGEPLLIHGMSDRNRRRDIAMDLLERVGMSADDVNRYPHEFSGGQKQRIALARALVLNPDLIVADEPVSALDVSIQADILSLMDDLKDRFGLSMLFISHNMGVIRQVCDRVAVMYLGEIVEMAPTEELFEDPKHPYTEALLSSIPEPDPRKRGRSIELHGAVPSPANPPSGCRFHTRCPKVIQPDHYDLDQDNWRNVIAFRERVAQQNIDVEAMRETVAGHQGVSPDEVSKSDVIDEMRSEFHLPASLSDQTADDLLNDALVAVVNDEYERAIEAMAEEFTTVCEREKPTLESVTDGHTSACHLNEAQSSQYASNEPMSTSSAESD